MVGEFFAATPKEQGFGDHFDGVDDADEWWSRQVVGDTGALLGAAMGTPPPRKAREWLGHSGMDCGRSDRKSKPDPGNTSSGSALFCDGLSQCHQRGSR